MSQSLVKNILHITFSTKHRVPLIFEDIENEVHSYLSGICNNLECYSIKIGGYDDHVHVVCSLSKKIALMSLLEHLKSSSSKWIKTKDFRLKDFYWQGGYSAVSVDPKNLDNLIEYIERQREHHKKVSFKEELISLLKQNNLPYDERYIWE